MKTFDFVWTFKMNGIHLYMNELDHDYRKKFNQKVLLRNSNIPFLYHKEAYRNISVVKSKNCSFWCFPKPIFTKLFSPRVVDCVKCEIFKDSIWTVIKVCQPSLIWNIQFTRKDEAYFDQDRQYRDTRRWPEMDCEVTWHQLQARPSDLAPVQWEPKYRKDKQKSGSSSDISLHKSSDYQELHRLVLLLCLNPIQFMSLFGHALFN